jgi:hypothetical protein
MHQHVSSNEMLCANHWRESQQRSACALISASGLSLPEIAIGAAEDTP